MQVLFLIILIILVIIAIPILIKIYLSFDILQNRGIVRIKIYNFDIINYKIKYKDKKIIFYNKRKLKEIKLEFDSDKIDFAKEFQKQLLKRMYIKKLEAFFCVGVKENPFVSVMISSLIKITTSILKGVISFQKPTSIIKNEINNTYDENNAKLTISSCLSISITDLVVAFIITKKAVNKLKIREYKNGKQQKSSNWKYFKWVLGKY